MQSRRAIALVDCNNFYVSCERLFRPELEGKPVAVLSNNDGCVVSRSQEVKAIGIPMAAPWFKVKNLAKRHDVTALSSNYTLYADISNRVMQLLSQFSPNQQVYSIDECFLELTGMGEPTAHAQRMRGAIRQCVGIPVCVGIAQSKTLAKLANHVAKTQELGVCNFNELPEKVLDRMFEKLDAGAVWGVGRNSAIRLREMGIASVQDLRCADPCRIRAAFGVTMERTVAELNGICCHDVAQDAQLNKQIICSRSFGMPVTQLADLEQAAIAYTSRAAEKLRKSGGLSSLLQIYLRTNPHQKGAPQYHPALTLPLAEPTCDTRALCRAALAGIRSIYREGYSYQKTGVALCGISAAQQRPRTLFDDEAAAAKSSALMATLDAINRRMGSGTLRLLGEGYDKQWAMKRGNMSRRYTTELAEIAIAKA